MTTKIRLLHDTVIIPTGSVATTQGASDNTTKVATTAYVTTALANLADSAPGTLNTLNELAAALGDDASFSTTVTNSIALKAPLASPTFTGTAEIPNLTIGGAQGSDGQILTSTGSGIGWEDAAGGVTFKAFGTSSIMVGDSATGTINAANYNTGLGVDVFAGLTSGDRNTAVGFEAGNALTVHGDNTLFGYQAGKLLGGSSDSWEAQRNTFIGFGAGRDVDEGNRAIAIGYNAMMSSIGTTNNDVAIGYQAMQYRSSNTGDSVAIGGNAMRGDINQGYQNANRNVAVGSYALQVLETGANQNTAVGWYTGKNLTTGNSNTLLGSEAGEGLITGQKNSFIGFRSGEMITSGGFNVILGGYDGNEGGLDIRTSSNHVVISDGAGNIRMYAKNNGNIGIGTISPDSILHVFGAENGEGASVGQLRVQSSTAYGSSPKAGMVFTNQHTSGSQAIMGGIYVGKDTTANGNYAGHMAFSTRAHGAVSVERMRIDSSGNVGIGTTLVTDAGLWYDANPGYLAISHWATPPTPAAMLHLSDNSNDLDVPQIRIEGRENAGDTKLDISVKDAGTRMSLIEGSGDAGQGYGLMEFKTNAAANASHATRGGFKFSTVANANNLFITNTGNIGIQTDSPAHLGRTGSGPVIHLAGSNDDCQLRLVNSILHHDNSGNTNLYLRNHYTTLGNDNNAKVTLEAGKIVFATSTNYTNRWQIDSSGHFTPSQQHTVDIGGTNAEVRNIYAQGISFASHANYSGKTSELLDDYEEGNHTATITCASGTITLYSTYNNLEYTKIGRLVHIQGKLAIQAVSSPSGATTISLPFAIANLTDQGGACSHISTGYFNGGSIHTGFHTVYMEMTEGQSYVRPYVLKPSSTAGNAPGTHNIGDGYTATGSDIYLNFSYIAA